MKKALFYFLGLAVLCTAWFGFNRAMLPASPEICGEISKTIDLDFQMNIVDLTKIELANTSDADIGPIFINFKMAGSWKTGNAGLSLLVLGDKSNSNSFLTEEEYISLKTNKKVKGTDFSHFMKDNKGKAVKHYKFQQTIVEESAGMHFMKMTYQGPAMKMIQFLTITEPIKLPVKLSKKFSGNNTVIFKPGTYYLDKKIKGFYIPVSYQ